MLSIIVPVYNVKDYLHKCVKSLISQSYTDLEIILVDDGSTDGSGEICDEFQTTDSRIKVIRKENGGPLSAWKAGVESAQGETVGFMDSDDYCDTDYFEKLIKELTKHDADIAIGGYIANYPDNSAKNVRQKASAYLEIKAYDGDELRLIKEKFFSRKLTLYWARWLRVIKKQLLLDNLHLVDERIVYGEDIGIALATLFDAKKIVLVDTYGYHYLQRSNSVMRAMTYREIANFELLCDNMEKICNDKGYDNNICREFTTQMIIVLLRILRADVGKREKINLLKELRKTAIVKRVYKERDFGERSKSGRILLEMFGKSMFYFLTLLPKRQV